MSEVVLHLTSGQGPQECRWVVAQLAAAYTREAEAYGVVCEVLEGSEDYPSSLLDACQRPTGAGVRRRTDRHGPVDRR